MTLSIRSVFWALALLLLGAFQALAADVKTFTVLPFTVNGPAGYKYLEQSIPQMFSSRLYWKGQLEPAALTVSKQAPPADEAAAEKARAAANADFVIWGSITIVGEDCSLDVRVRDRAGKEWPRSREAKVNQLIPALKGISDSISAEVFQRPRQESAARSEAATERTNRMNPELVHNETTPKEVYMNPAFRYSGTSGDDTRLRSQNLPFASVGMEICDADGDGKNEVFLLSDHKLRAFHYDNGRLDQLAEFDIPLTQQALSIRSIDINRTRKPLLVLVAMDSNQEPVSRLVSFNGKAFKEEAKTNQYYLNVTRLSPDFLPVLIGQAPQPPRLFRPGVYEMNVRGNSISQGRKIALPEGSNVFNFSYVPPGRDKNDSAKVIMLTDDERLRLYSDRGARLAQTEETYSGGSQGISVNQAMPGMGKDNVTIDKMFFIPLRFVIADLARDGNQQILVNKPISTAGTIFANYRQYPQAEIHSLYWDGVGLNLLWKTRRIKGTMVDYAVADLNNDGIPDLITCINTYAGALGTDARKTLVLAYPLDLSKTSRDTAPDQSEFER